MSRRGIAALPLALTLAACAPPQAPAPITLSYPYAAEQGLNLDRLRALAQQVAGAYVRVVVYQEGRGPDMPARSVVNGASGTVIDPRGFIVTAAHIAKDDGTAPHHRRPGQRAFAARALRGPEALESASCRTHRSMRSGHGPSSVGTGVPMERQSPAIAYYNFPM